MKSIFLLILLSAVPFSAHAKEEGSWEVLVTGLPEKITTEGARGNIAYYILKQTHEPVFRLRDGQNYTSTILKSWTRSPDYKNFLFCPEPNLGFDPRSPFGLEKFAEHISSVTIKYDAGVKLVKEDGCVRVSFNKQRKGYLEYLTRYENAPTKKVSDRLEAGLGAYFVGEAEKDRVTLIRKKKVRGGYGKIVFHEYSGPKDPNLKNRNIKDFNIIPGVDVPNWVKDEYTRFENVELKSVNLIINHPDLKVRARVYNCVDVQALRTAFFTGKKDFFNIGNILPMGISGAVPGLPEQTCEKTDAIPAKLHFANWMFGNSEGMKKYAEDFTKKSGIKLSLDAYSPQEIVSVLNKSPRPFNLVILVFDAVRPDPTAFFDSFSKGDGFHDFILPQLVVEYKKLLYEEDEAEKERLAKKLADMISKNALSLPLYQNIRVLYYPKEIKNLSVGRGFLEYPEVAEFRW